MNPAEASTDNPFKHSLRLLPEKINSFTWMQPGANNEVWWTGTYGVEQIKEFMLLIKNIKDNVNENFKEKVNVIVNTRVNL